MCTSTLSGFTLSLHHNQHHRSIPSLFPKQTSVPFLRALSASAISPRIFVEQVAGESSMSETDGDGWGFGEERRSEGSFEFDASFSGSDMKHSPAPELEVKELAELPEQWRRTKLAWLCKELPTYKHATLVRLLNAQRKWMRQEDATYVAIHCMRIRENEAGFKVYKWMIQQHWYQFDFALATKLADYMGKERKFSKCRDIFDDIINQGRCPSESTFHILIVAYLSAPVQGNLEEACDIYNRMIQLGGYQPRLSLHNSLFRAVVSQPGGSAKKYLKQAEFIFHNLVTSGFEIHKDIYGGLIWLHSYQDSIEKERIASLREDMKGAGISEDREVLVSILRACSKEGDVEEAERTWQKLLRCDGGLPSQSFVNKMEVYAKVGDPGRSLEIFREMQQKTGSVAIVAYHKIIEILCKAQEVELAELLMVEFIESGMKPLMPSFVDIMNLYFNMSLHGKLELAFTQSLEKCRPNLTIYSIYLDSLVKVGHLSRAEEIFGEMRGNTTVGVNARSSNTILSGYLLAEDFVKAEKIYDLMCQKKYDVEPQLIEKMDYVLNLKKKQLPRSRSPTLSKEQREILLGLLLGSLQIESDEQRKNHRIRFEFNGNAYTHSVLKHHIYDQFQAWLHPSSKPNDGTDDLPHTFLTISHSHFGFYADQFWPQGRYAIPKLIHRWLSPCVLAYWYMYGGQRISSGDIVLKLKGNLEGVEKIVKTLKAQSLDCKVKRNRNVFWIGFLGSNSTWFWKLVEPYILEDLKCHLEAGGDTVEHRSLENLTTGSVSDSDVYGL